MLASMKSAGKHGFVYFGSEPVGFDWENGISDGQTIFVTGTLAVASAYEFGFPKSGKPFSYCLLNASWHK